MLFPIFIDLFIGPVVLGNFFEGRYSKNGIVYLTSERRVVCKDKLIRI